MKQKMKKSLLAPCGINCNICSSHLSKKDPCPGCHERIRSVKGCIIHRCDLRRLSKSGFCYECIKFPCRRIKQLDERYRKNADISVIENLSVIRDRGAAALLDLEIERWHCPECGGILANNRACYNCGYGRRIFRGPKIPPGKITEENLIAPCGMNCGLCGNYQAMKYDLHKTGAKKPYCLGCYPRGRGCSPAKSGHCEKLMGRTIRFCYECEKFPCKSVKRLDDSYRTRFNMSMIENLEHIRDKGMVSFLKQQREKWHCPGCGELICCHTGTCLNCGTVKFQPGKK